jgi:hypothetical protein
LRELAKLAGADPRYFYRGVDLSGVDLRAQDLRGMDFTGADLSRARIDPSTLFDRRLALAYTNRGEYRHAMFPNNLLEEANTKSKSLSISRRRLLRSLIYSSTTMLENNKDEREIWIKKLRDDAIATRYFQTGRTERRYQQFRIEHEQHRFALNFGRNFPGTSAGYIALVLIGFERQ